MLSTTGLRYDHPTAARRNPRHGREHMGLGSTWGGNQDQEKLITSDRRAMTAPNPTVPAGSAPEGTATASSSTHGSDDGAPVTRLRGAGVDVDARRVGRAVVVLCLVGLGVLTVILFIAGVNRNDQVTELRDRGVPVVITVSGCQGLIGGTGGNAAGYQCRGSLTLRGHRYNEAIPGDTFHRPGTTIQALAVPGDAALLAPTSAVAAEHPSWRVFILPTVLLIVLISLIAVVIGVRRSSARHASTSAT
jgi:hypothetical protein